MNQQHPCNMAQIHQIPQQVTQYRIIGLFPVSDHHSNPRRVLAKGTIKIERPQNIVSRQIFFGSPPGRRPASKPVTGGIAASSTHPTRLNHQPWLHCSSMACQ
jgi:hypothetical protein